MPEMTSILEVSQQSAPPPEHVTIRNVLVPTDLSEFSERALRFAIGIAGRYESNLHLFHCVDPRPFNLAEDPQAAQTTCDDVRRDLKGIAGNLRRQYRARNFDVKALVTAGDFAENLQRVLEDLDPGLIVVGTHGRTGLRKLMLGSVTEAVIDRASCPVLTVGPWTDRTRLQEFGPRNILLARSRSNPSTMAESYAFSVARKYGSRLTLVDVLDDRGGRVHAEISQLEWYEASQMDTASVSPNTTSLQVPIEIDTQSDLILNMADQSDADLIVLAVPRNHRFTDRFVSTDSYRVVCGSPCPVLTVRAGAQEAGQ